jgi:hypothetical protein
MGVCGCVPYSSLDLCDRKLHYGLSVIAGEEADVDCPTPMLSISAAVVMFDALLGAAYCAGRQVERHQVGACGAVRGRG